jgi:threonine dehydrogenase-like Zn-dependent dehydrogenase
VTGEVLVRITHSGVCGTDWKIFNGRFPFPIRSFPATKWPARLIAAGADL